MRSNKDSFFSDAKDSFLQFSKQLLYEINKEIKRNIYKAITNKEPPKEKEPIEYGMFPSNLKRSGGVPFGKARTKYGMQTVYFPKDDNSHKIVLGATRSGKTEWAKQYVVNAKTGVCFIDNADGEAIDDILLSLPDDRLKKTVILDHSDKFNPLCIDLFRLQSDIFNDDESAELWIQFFVSNFDLETQYMTIDLISNACRAVFGVDETTILDVVRMVQSSKARSYFLDKCENKDVLRWWNRYNIKNQKESSHMQTTASFLRRANILMRNRILKYTLGSKNKTKLDYRKWIDEGWTVLIKVPESLGRETVRVIASVHFTNFIQATFSRDNIPKKDRKQFFLIADEPQTWLYKNADKLDDMFSKSAKYGLSLVLLFQSFQQIRKESPALVEIILDNLPDLIVFTTSNNQLRLGKFDLENLPKYHFICRIRDNRDVFLAKSLGKIRQIRKSPPDVVRECKQKYNTNYQIIENKLERKDSIWENEVNIEEIQLDAQIHGLKPNVYPELQKRTKQSSRSFIMLE